MVVPLLRVGAERVGALEGAERAAGARVGALEGAERVAGARVGALEGAERVAGARDGAREGALRVVGALCGPLRAIGPLDGAGWVACTLPEGVERVADALLDGADRVDGAERLVGALYSGSDRYTDPLVEGALRAVDPRFTPELPVTRLEGRLAFGTDPVPLRADGVLAAGVPEEAPRDTGVLEPDAPTAGVPPPRTRSEGRAAALGVRAGAPTRDWGCRAEGVPLAPAVGEVLPTWVGVARSATPALGVP